MRPLPRLRVRVACAEDINAETLAHFVPRTWVTLRGPDRLLPHSGWRRLFCLVGYTVDGAPSVRPRLRPTVYRGAATQRSRRWSWTTSPGVARRFATSEGQRSSAGRLWTVEALPEALLARWNDRDEQEVVSETDRLDGPILPLLT